MAAKLSAWLLGDLVAAVNALAAAVREQSAMLRAQTPAAPEVHGPVLPEFDTSSATRPSLRTRPALVQNALSFALAQATPDEIRTTSAWVDGELARGTDPDEIAERILRGSDWRP